MEITQYIARLNKRYKSGVATEHSYRGDLQHFLESLLNGIHITNEPKRVKCGAPDYILTRNKIPIGYIEAKDIGKHLDDKSYKDQFDRYRQSLPNLIITNYLDFLFYRNGTCVANIQVAKIHGKDIQLLQESVDPFQDLLRDFVAFGGQTITSSSELARMMAGKARLMANVISNAIEEDISIDANSDLYQQLKAFKLILIHDIDAHSFADIYSQTIAYGLFAARLHDRTLDTFSRKEAAELIPKSNPFLRKLFQNIAGPDLDERIDWIVDALADIFRATDVASLLKDFGKSTQQNDPFLHFYETFLAEYDPKLRKSRGVWYTPEPVVNFIVRAVDEILTSEFGLKDGLADASKISVSIETYKQDKRYSDGVKKEKKKVHKVQILDPATGTGTFLADVIKQIYQKFIGQHGVWNEYVEKELIPRLNGFELLMAPYAMAHLKLELLLRETGYIAQSNKRLQVYLTNSLEEHHPDTGTLFASWLSNEASEANHIKRDTPVMVVLGNPPYAVSSSNKGIWIQEQIKVYKKDLNEKKLNLDDDYIKFIRYGEQYIEKNGDGILAYISNNSFIDGVTHRQMRKHLIDTFDKIYILDLHGNAKKKETAPDGSKDENVFDIMQGVSINIFVKSSKRYRKKEIYHFDVFGTRKKKYSLLFDSSIKTIQWKKAEPGEPYYFFIPNKTQGNEKYETGFSLTEIFFVFNNGLKTDRDELFLDDNKKQLESRIMYLLGGNLAHDFVSKYRVIDSGSYKITKIISKIKYNSNYISSASYRPFDTRWIYYDPNIISRPAEKVMKHMVGKTNYSLALPRQVPESEVSGAWVTRSLCGHKVFSAYNINTVFPLYTYQHSYTDENENLFVSDASRKPNLNPVVVSQFSEILGLKFEVEKSDSLNCFSPIDILDYIYSVLYSTKYRKKYKEFLKIDFPRIPYPDNARAFWKLVKYGGELRQLHLLESPVVEHYITTYPISGGNKITRSIDKSDYEIIEENNQIGRIWINETQYFSGIPKVAWDLYIGGYQPAQRWLKDRKGHTLEISDIFYYQKIIIALSETNRISNEIDMVLML